MLILGTHINDDQALLASLQKILGLNTSTALKICSLAGVCPKVKLRKLNVSKANRLVEICRDQVNGNLTRYVQNNVDLLIKIKHYKGTRHMFGLPSRGQRTRTNARTSKKLTKKKKIFGLSHSSAKGRNVKKPLK